MRHELVALQVLESWGQKNRRSASHRHGDLLVRPQVVHMVQVQLETTKDVQPVLLVQPPEGPNGSQVLLVLVEPIGSIAFSTCHDQIVATLEVELGIQESALVSAAHAQEEPSDDGEA